MPYAEEPVIVIDPAAFAYVEASNQRTVFDPWFATCTV